MEKSREIIRKLNEEKSHLEEEMRQKIENSEHSLEREKDSELQELRRGKKEALQVLQVSPGEITNTTGTVGADELGYVYIWLYKFI